MSGLEASSNIRILQSGVAKGSVEHLHSVAAFRTKTVSNGCTSHPLLGRPNAARSPRVANAFGPKRASAFAPHMSAFGVKRTLLSHRKMPASDAKRHAPLGIKVSSYRKFENATR
jgi:hypothetical protein